MVWIVDDMTSVAETTTVIQGVLRHANDKDTETGSEEEPGQTGSGEETHSEEESQIVERGRNGHASHLLQSHDHAADCAQIETHGRCRTNQGSRDGAEKGADEESRRSKVRRRPLDQRRIGSVLVP